jgi:hypothetical protein
MKTCRAASFVLLVWYLMQPPLPHLNAHATPTERSSPFSGWMKVGTFSTQKECEAHRANPWERCVANDDARLKEK